MISEDQFHIHELTAEDRANIDNVLKTRSSFKFRFINRMLRAYISFKSKKANRDLNDASSQDKAIKRNLHIYYRHVHVREDNPQRFKSKRRPDWFSYKRCFLNLLNTIKHDPLSSRVKITILFDGTHEDFRNDFIYDYCQDKSIGLDIQFINGGCDLNSFIITLGVVRNTLMQRNDLIYLLENDYVHQSGWVSKVFEIYDSGHKFDYLSLYDHGDLYDSMIYSDLTSRLFYTKNHHWRTAPSTCASFILERHIFERDLEIFRLGLPDYYMFRKLVRKRGVVLLNPVPGLSTHSMAEFLSPVVDWEKLAGESQR